MGLCQTKQDLQNNSATQPDNKTLPKENPQFQKQPSTTTNLTQEHGESAQEAQGSVLHIQVHPPSENKPPAQPNSQDPTSLITGSQMGSLLKTKPRQTNKRQQSQMKYSIFAQPKKGSNLEQRPNSVQRSPVLGADTLMVPGSHRPDDMTSHVSIHIEDDRSSAYHENQSFGSLVEISHWPKNKPSNNNPASEEPLGANVTCKEQPSGGTGRAKNKQIALTTIPERVESKPSVWRVDKGNKK